MEDGHLRENSLLNPPTGWHLLGSASLSNGQPSQLLIVVKRESRRSVRGPQEVEKVGELPSSIFTLPRAGERWAVSFSALCVYSGSRGCTPGNEKRSSAS